VEKLMPPKSKEKDGKDKLLHLRVKDDRLADRFEMVKEKTGIQRDSDAIRACITYTANSYQNLEPHVMVEKLEKAEERIANLEKVVAMMSLSIMSNAPIESISST
jgi:hypothetical protein